MRTLLAILLLAAAVALNAAAAFACRTNVEARSLFFGDGFDNTTCADMPRPITCR